MCVVCVKFRLCAWCVCVCAWSVGESDVMMSLVLAPGCNRRLLKAALHELVIVSQCESVTRGSSKIDQRERVSSLCWLVCSMHSLRLESAAMLDT